VDDSLATAAIDFSATDKISVFAGVRKLSDAARASIFTHNGTGLNSFGAEAPNAASANNMLLYALGASGRNPGNVTGLASPITYTFVAICDIANTGTATYYLNGVKGADVSGVLVGDAKFANAVLHIGRRNGADLPFNGHIYSMIVRGVSSTAQEITDAESYVNGKTGAY
jgi:hypothetical protein